MNNPGADTAKGSLWRNLKIGHQPNNSRPGAAGEPRNRFAQLFCSEAIGEEIRDDEVQRGFGWVPLGQIVMQEDYAVSRKTRTAQAGAGEA
jgi:hypothetical protein